MKAKTIYTFLAFIFIFMAIWVYFIRDNGSNEEQGEETSEETLGFNDLIQGWAEGENLEDPVITQNPGRYKVENIFSDNTITINIFEEEVIIATKQLEAETGLKIYNIASINDAFVAFELRGEYSKDCSKVQEEFRADCELEEEVIEEHGGIWIYDINSESFEKIISFRVN